MKKALILIAIVSLFVSCNVAKKIIDDNLPEDKDQTEDVIAEITGEKKEIVIDTNITILSKKEIKKIKKEREKQDKIARGDTLGFIKKNYYQFFPKREDRIVSYPNMYSEKPKSILLIYPWNRSKNQYAPEMYLINISKELSQKGYYVVPTIITLEHHKKDTMFSSQFLKAEQITKYKEEYGVDAVMFLTIYSLSKPWWSTNINSVAEYTLLSTSTSDTLFYRKADFNYDSPIPPYKPNKSKDTYEMDQRTIPIFGTCFQMQRSVFMDFPYGPYHKNYLKDKKKFSYQKEMRYKIDARPS
ncbi:MAG: GNA1162 family protein [Bacteroidales bacterium]